MWQVFAGEALEAVLAAAPRPPGNEGSRTDCSSLLGGLRRGLVAVTVYTIGHSTRTLDEFIALLRAHSVAQLADVRTIPKSRRHPHFAADALSLSLAGAGIGYRHARELGGLRKPAAGSRNMAWRHQGFRGYADYMETA